MKQNQNIEKSFKRLKKSYKVPENYFERLESNLEFKFQEKGNGLKTILFNNWKVAASILLFLGLSFYFLLNNFHRYSNDSNLSTTSPQQENLIIKEELFNELDEEDIEEYIVDNGLIDEFYIEEINN